MKMTRKLLTLALAAALAAFVAGAALAAESFTVTAVASEDADIGSGWANAFKVLKLAWTASGDGTKGNETVSAVKGWLRLVATDPGATAPADNYDIYLLDAEGVDVLGGAGLNRDTANSEQATPHVNGSTDFSTPRPVYGPLTFSLSGNANADALGEVFLYYTERP